MAFSNDGLVFRGFHKIDFQLVSYQNKQ